MIFVHSALPEFQLFGADDERFNIPGRVIPLVRPEDHIVLPRDPRVEAFWRFWSRLAGLDDDQVVWTPGTQFLLTQDIQGDPGVAQRVHHLLRDRVASVYAYWQKPTVNGHRVRFHPDALMDGHSPPFYRKRMMGELVRAAGLSGTGCYPRTSQVCATPGQLIDAIEQFQAAGVERMLVKPDLGSAGDGIEGITLESAASYAFASGPVLVQELLEIDRDDLGREILVAVHWECSEATGGRVELFGGVKDQLMHGKAWAGTRSPSRTPAKFQEEALHVARTLLEQSRFREVSTGGMDFASVNGRPVLLDVNPRFTGAHTPELWVGRHAPGRVYTMWSTHAHGNPGVEEVWAKLQTEMLAFDPFRGPNETGVFPLCWLPGVSTKLIAIGTDPTEVEDLQARASELF